MVRINPRDPRNAQFPARLHGACDLANNLIARKARELACRYRWDDRDVEDIASDLWLATLRSWETNPDHPNPEALTTVVVQRASISMLRRRCSERRNPARRVPDLEPDLIIAPEPYEDLELRLDIEDLSRRLTPEAQSLVDGLRESTMAGISRRTGVPRSTLYGRHKEIREIFKPLTDTSEADRDVHSGDTL